MKNSRFDESVRPRRKSRARERHRERALPHFVCRHCGSFRSIRMRDRRRASPCSARHALRQSRVRECPVHGRASRIPQRLDRRPGKLVVLRLRRMLEASVDQVHDRQLATSREVRQRLDVGIVGEPLRQLLQDASQRVAQPFELLRSIRVKACLARVLNVFLALEDLVERFRRLAARAEQVDLRDERIEVSDCRRARTTAACSKRFRRPSTTRL